VVDQFSGEPIQQLGMRGTFAPRAESFDVATIRAEVMLHRRLTITRATSCPAPIAFGQPVGQGRRRNEVREPLGGSADQCFPRRASGISTCKKPSGAAPCF